MQLQLHKANDGLEGYVSTLDNQGNFLVCKPVSTEEFDSLLADIKKNKRYSIKETNLEGWVNPAYVIQEIN